jgi:hypothetical protein
MTSYKDMDTAALLMWESGLDYYDDEIIQELADRAGLTVVWENALMYDNIEQAYAQIIMKLTR